MSLRDSAVELARRGFYVFRLRPNAKFPAFKGWQNEATNDPAKVHDLWTVAGTEMQYNIGIALQPGMFAFDEDVSNGKTGDKSRALLEALYEELPRTFTVRSARGGAHRYMTSPLPTGNSASKVGKHIDIKAVDGFAVGPGSVTEDGEYTIELDAPIAPAPAWLAEMAAAKRERKTNDGTPLVEDLDTEAAKARATEYLTRRAPDHGTFTVAARVKDFGISAPTCFDLMMEHWPPAEAKGDEHVLFRVENAYRYGQNAPGNAAPEAEFEAVEIDAKEPPKRKGLHSVRWHDAKPVLDFPYLIDGILDLGIMAVTYGDSNVGKSYVKLDQCFHIAAGREWNGRKVKQGLVVYVAAEGGLGFLKRIEAFKRHYKADNVPFSLVPCPIDLQSEAADTAKLVKLIREEEAYYGQKCVLVVIDTLARVMAGGDENTAVDMSKFVGHADRLRAAVGATVDIIHHTGKDASKGARGSSALRAATDTEIEVGNGTLTVTKQRDMGKMEPLRFELEGVEVGRRADGAAVSACVVRWVTAAEFDERLSPQAAEMLAVLERLIAAKRDEIAEDETIPETDKSDKIANARVEWKLWELAVLSVLKGARGKPIGRTHLYPIRQELSDCGKVKKDKHNHWFIA